MDRNTITGFSLIFLILIGYYWYTAPTAEEQAIFQRQRDSVARIEAAKVTSPRILLVHGSHSGGTSNFSTSAR
ncbi:MAG: hypothetical protein NTZ00_02950 [Bacteroidetes bacterium]|nr:hypothetical protein [Bacteroidota bacterium]